MSEITKLDDVSLDDFVEYKDTDKQGKFSYVGKVIKVDKEANYFEMLTMNANRQGFYMRTSMHNGKLFKGEKPVGWDKFEKNPDAYTEKQQEKKEAKKKEEHTIRLTTKEKVFALVKDNPELDSAKLLKRARQDIGGDDSLLTMFIKVAIMHQRKK